MDITSWNINKLFIYGFRKCPYVFATYCILIFSGEVARKHSAQQGQNINDILKQTVALYDGHYSESGDDLDLDGSGDAGYRIT